MSEEKWDDRYYFEVHRAQHIASKAHVTLVVDGEKCGWSFDYDSPHGAGLVLKTEIPADYFLSGVISNLFGKRETERPITASMVTYELLRNHVNASVTLDQAAA
jgi:hypothetical protein